MLIAEIDLTFFVNIIVNVTENAVAFCSSRRTSMLVNIEYGIVMTHKVSRSKGSVTQLSRQHAACPYIHTIFLKLHLCSKHSQISLVIDNPVMLWEFTCHCLDESPIGQNVNFFSINVHRIGLR